LSILSARSQNCEEILLALHCLSLFLSVCLSTWNNSVPAGRIFMKYCILAFFENLSRNFKIHKLLTRITGTLREDQYTILITSRSFLLRIRNISDKRCTENKTCILYTTILFKKIVPSMRYSGKEWQGRTGHR